MTRRPTQKRFIGPHQTAEQEPQKGMRTFNSCCSDTRPSDSCTALASPRHRSRLVLKGAMLLALWGESTYRSMPKPARADQWRAYLIRSSLPGVPDDFRTCWDDR